MKFADTQLEELLACPNCGAKDEGSWFLQNVEDRLYQSSEDVWGFRRCKHCGQVYLSPRLSEEYISLAYRSYYTHGRAFTQPAARFRRSFIDSLVRTAYNAYRSGSTLKRYAIKLLRLVYPLTTFVEAKMRHLYLSNHNSPMVLDIGCGDGGFLSIAQALGLKAEGIDPDPNAVAAAKAKGLNVACGTIDSLIDYDRRFEFITLSHVIEHVYDPVHVLSQCYRLLTVGGILWIETPNVESIGLTLFRTFWRGLEPPRHIFLFDRDILRKYLMHVGFRGVREMHHGLSGTYMAFHSSRIRWRLIERHTPIDKALFFSEAVVKGLCSELVQTVYPRKREFLTFVCHKTENGP